MELKNVIESELLPTVNLGDYKRVEKRKKADLIKLYWLCFFNKPYCGDDEESIKNAAQAYGKMLYKHYEIKQEILDHFWGQNPSDLEEIETLKKKACDVFKNKINFFLERRPPLPSHDDLKQDNFNNRYDLTKHDSNRDRQPVKYSELYLSLLERDELNPYLTEYSTDPSSMKKWENKLLMSYLANLVRTCITEIANELKRGKTYKSRWIVENQSEAIRDFLKYRREGTELRPIQQAYLINLQYWLDEKDNPISVGDNPVRNIANNIPTDL